MEIDTRGSEKSLSFCCLKIDNKFCVSRLTREGSGNFLIITYKELRRLEINILVKQREIRDSLNEKAVYQGELIADASKISLSQFSGIELDDFAHEVARLSLYIAEHQINVEMEEALADVHPRLLPLREAGNIVCGNALRIDWETVLNAKEDEEV